MKKVKKICALILALVIAVSLCACEEESGMSEVEEALQGDWEASWPSVVGTCYQYLHFDNGLVTASFKGGYETQGTGTYTIDEETQQITLTWESYSETSKWYDGSIPDPVVYSYTYENGILSIDTDSELLVYKKIG
jgi:uncharacterized lipoprotein YehR (DUF1307 family)